ncbi:PHA/PHB synthase family protein [Aestuariibius insulae]|uniref:PHA/PHB synthase family protein n=1 Tax=Aestuariibius insulae TaxID=2058287 RepID=UPI00345E4E5A
MTTTNSEQSHGDLEALEHNLARIEELTQRLVGALSAKRSVPEALQGPSQDLYVKAMAAYLTDMMQNPAKMIEHQVSYWGKSLKHYVEAQQALASGRLTAPPDETGSDRRFANPLWETHPYFNFLKQQYMFNSDAITRAVGDIEGLDPKEKKRLDYFSRQIVDLFSPSNFLGTNPEALEQAVKTDGQSLVDGLENLVADLEANEGDLQVTLADKDAFKVGENLATTEGEVVFRNRFFELIQYAPKTKTVHQTPLIIFPPWINKFYILDLKPQNSLIRWVVEQGFTLFVVSWVNPDPSYRDAALGDYIEEGYLTAIREVKAICDVPKVNVVGYCIAGTTLALTLSLMKHRGDTSVNSATFFTTLTDFSDQGEVGVFLDDDFVDGIEEEVERNGILDAFYMQRTFSFLRSNDLIYGPAIKSYMMGQAPPAFDLLFWNGDGTHLPAAMSVQYLRQLCQQDRFADGGIEILGERLHLEDVDVPLCAIACETDHIAAWRSSYRGIQQMGSTDKTFILSGSGHIAGIVNPPAKKKYGHWTGDDLTVSPDEWLDAATKQDGSWWPLWQVWLAKMSGKKIKARSPGDSEHPSLGSAPGTYVLSVSDS